MHDAVWIDPAVSEHVLTREVIDVQDSHIEVFLEDDPGRMVYVLRGSPDLQQVQAAMQEVSALVLATNNVEHYRQALVDARAGSITNISPADQKQLFMDARAVRDGAGLSVDGSQLAIVVAADVDFGMGRMVEMRGEGTEPAIRRAVFKDLSEAIRWLDAPGESMGITAPA